MTEQKQDREFILLTTAVGEASFPWLTKPATNFNKDGVYQTKLYLDKDSVCKVRVDKEDAVEVKLTEYLDEMAEKAYAEGDVLHAEALTKVKKGKAAPTHDHNQPYILEYDDKDNETGRIYISAKRNATKAGKTETDPRLPVTLKFYDSAKAEIQNPKPVFSGSMIRLACLVSPYTYVGGSSGISLKVMSVQIIKLNTGGGGMSSDFDAEEDGYRTGVVNKEEDF